MAIRSRSRTAMMSEAALAMLASDPRRVEKAKRALASLRACSQPIISPMQTDPASRDGDNE